MMGPGNQQQQDNSMAMLWIIAGVMIFCGMVWYLFKDYIVHAFVVVRNVEMYPIHWAIDTGLLPEHYVREVHRVSEYLNTTPASAFNYRKIPWISDVVGKFYCIPIALFLFVGAFLVYRSNISEEFKKTYDMQRFVEQEHVNWPQVTPVCKMRLDQVDIEKGPWSMSLRALDFCRRYHLLAEEIDGPERVHFDPRVKRTATLIKDRAANVMSMQLGRHWHSVEALPKHLQAIFAAFAARIAGDREGSAELLDYISESTAHGQLDFSRVTALLDKHRNHKIVRRVTASHAYEGTVLAQMLDSARNDGVFASADFLWLKPVDRNIWFMLNSVGRQTPFTEVAGMFAHWLAEKEIGRPLHVPMVEEAVIGLELALNETIYTPPEDD